MEVLLVRPTASTRDRTAVSKTVVALGASYIGLAFGWRTWLQWRQTGDSGYRLSRSAGTPARVASLLMVGGAVASLAGAVRGATPNRDQPWSQRAGVGLMMVSMVVTLRAQTDMGRSWRIGVDENERTELVTGGLFRLSRNPIFASMASFATGTALAAPNVLTATGAAAVISGVQLQVRQIEEPYLIGVHGDSYRTCMKGVGRFVPFIGRTKR